MNFAVSSVVQATTCTISNTNCITDVISSTNDATSCYLWEIEALYQNYMGPPSEDTGLRPNADVEARPELVHKYL